MTDLTRVTGIGPGLAAQLTAAGISDAEALAQAKPDDILSVRGIGAGTAPVLIARAKHLTAPTPAPASPAAPASAEKPTKDKKRSKTSTSEKTATKDAGKKDKKPKAAPLKADMDKAEKAAEEIEAKAKKKAKKAEKKAAKAEEKAKKKSGKTKAKAKKSASKLKAKAKSIKTKAVKKAEKIKKKALKATN